MRGRLWIEVLEGDRMLVLVHDLRGDLSLSDLTKQAVRHRTLLLLEKGDRLLIFEENYFCKNNF
jgi:hypothetical protein